MRKHVVLALGLALVTGVAAPGAGAAGEEAAGAGVEREVLFWKSPMDPNFVSKSPGKDPMGMDLVPVYEGEAVAGSAGTVRIDPVTVQNIGVKTAVVERKDLSHPIRTVGRIDYDETRVRTISPKIGGWVERQYVNFTGQVVEKGERLLEIYSPELVSTQEEYLLALRYRERLEKSPLGEEVTGRDALVRATEARLRYWDITDQQIRALRGSGAITRTMALHAPFRGIVLERHVLEGGSVRPGQALYKIADVSTVWVYADVYEYEAPWVRAGQEATIRIAYRPGEEYRGRVDYVYPYLENKTRTLQVRMEFPNSNDFDLKPDMWADVELSPSAGRQAVTVPVQSVIRTGRRDVVLLALGDGRFAPREVKLGAQAGDQFEVLEGLEEGQRIVTSSQFLINSESNLQSALQRMLEGDDDEAAQDVPAAHDAHGGG